MKIETLVQAISFLLDRKSEALDKLSLLKLIFFADKYHMMKYARSITNDTYYAMKYGPVASNMKNILDFDFLADAEKEYIEKYLVKNNNQINIKEKFAKYNMLSDTDKEALKFAYENFGKYKTFDLVDITHQFYEWKRFEKSLENGLTREKILEEDFFKFSDIENDPYKNIPEELVKLSCEFYFGKVM